MIKRLTPLIQASIAYLLVSCASPQATPTSLTVKVTADNQSYQLQLPAGSTVQQALSATALSLQPLDRVEPAVYTLLTEGAEIRIIRVKESFEVVRETIPFERQVVYNESLPQDQEVLLQRGKNGVQEVTYRQVFEDGVKVSSLPVPMKLTVIEEPVAEIVMVGIQSPFIPINIPGRLVYLRDGNVWLMEGSTANRRAVVTTGDVDGRIFTLSTAGSWLLFTRKSKESGVINTLWALDLGAESPKLVNLSVENIIHFADFLPSSTTKIVFSTVEPREAPPGWQANNDLNALTFSDTGWTTKWTIVLEPNSGGIYGWWGTEFLWSPTNRRFAFARPDSIGSWITTLVRRLKPSIFSLIKLVQIGLGFPASPGEATARLSIWSPIHHHQALPRQRSRKNST